MKTFRLIGMALFAITLSVSLTACGDDDDDDNGGTIIGTSTGTGSPSGSVSHITTDDGETVLLSSVSGYETYRFAYDDEGRCTYAYGENAFAMSYDPFTLTCIEYDDEYETYSFALSFNSAGYISKIEGSYKYDDGEESESSSGTYNFTYDSNYRLTKITMSGSGTDYEDGENVKYTSSGTVTLTWGGTGCLYYTNLEATEKSAYGTYTTTDHFAYEYGETANKYQMYTAMLAENTFEAFPEFALLGYFGKGPSYLPSAVSNTYTDDEDGEEYTSNYSYTLAYTLNSNGTINTETATYNSYYNSTNTYTYTTVATRALAEDVTAVLSSDSGKKMAKKLFRLHSKKARD